MLRITWARHAAEASGQRYELKFDRQSVNGTEASVTATLTTDAPHSMVFTLVRQGRWRIVDVSVEGASAVAAWSQQLHRELEKRGPAGLVALVRERADSAAGTHAGNAVVRPVAVKKAPDPMEMLLFGALEAQAQPSSSPTVLLLLQLWSD